MPDSTSEKKDEEREELKQNLSKAYKSGKLDPKYFEPAAENEKVVCNACKTSNGRNATITLGSNGLSNVYAHERRPAHKNAVQKAVENLLKKKVNQVGNNSKSGAERDQDIVNISIDENEARIAEKFKCVVDKYGQCFKREGDFFVCSYCTARFNSLPKRGDVISNIKHHVDSPEHKKVEDGGKKQSLMSSFFITKKRKVSED